MEVSVIKSAARRLTGGLWPALILFSLFLLSFPARAQTNGWYPDWLPLAKLRCSLSSQNVNLGAYSLIGDPAPRATGDWDVACSSNVYQKGYPSTYSTVSAGYCVTIAGKQGQQFLTGQDGEAKGRQMPISFYFSRQKKFESSWQPDYDTPIGDGSWGIPYIDWNYIDGDPKIHNRNNIPFAAGSAYNLPARGRLDVQIAQSAGQVLWPAGVYSGSFNFNYAYGVTNQAGDWPRPHDSYGCGSWPHHDGSGVISVSLTIKKFCNISSIKDINFNTQYSVASAIDQTGYVTVQCTNDTKFQVGIGDGYHSPAAGQRYMTLNGMNGAADNQRIAYDLYQDSGRTMPWGNIGTKNVMELEGTGAAINRQIPVYARIPPQTDNKVSGPYLDTVIITVNIADPGSQ